MMTLKVENYEFSLSFGKIDVYHACMHFSNFYRPTFGRFHGNEESILKLSIVRHACKIPSLKFEQQILSHCFFVCIM